jgi:hypothetical protein
MNTTQYTFIISGRISVVLPGDNTDKNYDKAKRKAVQSALQQIDEDWILDVTADEFTDYEILEEVVA